MDHPTAEHIYTSWGQINWNSNRRDEFGNLMFQRIRDVSPRLGAMFFSAKNGHESSGPSAEYGGENSSNVKAGGNHARLFVDMLESMVNMLGPDMDSFAELVFQLGAKHSSYGVKSVDFPIMGQALIFALEETLGRERFSGPVKEAWRSLWRWTSLTMIRGARSVVLDRQVKNEKKSKSQQSTSTTTDEAERRRGRRCKSSRLSTLKDKIKSRSLSRGRRRQQQSRKNKETSSPIESCLSPSTPIQHVSSTSFSVRRRNSVGGFDPRKASPSTASTEESLSDDHPVSPPLTAPSRQKKPPRPLMRRSMSFGGRKKKTRAPKEQEEKPSSTASTEEESLSEDDQQETQRSPISPPLVLSTPTRRKPMTRSLSFGGRKKVTRVPKEQEEKPPLFTAPNTVRRRQKTRNPRNDRDSSKKSSPDSGDDDSTTMPIKKTTSTTSRPPLRSNLRKSSSFRAMRQKG